MSVAATVLALCIPASASAGHPERFAQDSSGPNSGFITDTLGGNGEPTAAGVRAANSPKTHGRPVEAAPRHAARRVTPRTRPVDPLAVSILNERGWSASRIYDWTQGACSYQVKPASCYLTPAQAKLASQRLAESMGARGPSARAVVDESASAASDNASKASGFDWGDAGGGAGVALGAVALLGASVARMRLRRQRLQGR
jgi:hypothetical protein